MVGGHHRQCMQAGQAEFKEFVLVYVLSYSSRAVNAFSQVPYSTCSCGMMSLLCGVDMGVAGEGGAGLAMGAYTGAAPWWWWGG